MAKTNVRRKDRGSGADFVNEKRAVDEAINERLKSENETSKLDPGLSNDKTKQNINRMIRIRRAVEVNTRGGHGKFEPFVYLDETTMSDVAC